jgi:hypothetical protein
MSAQASFGVVRKGAKKGEVIPNTEDFVDRKTIMGRTEKVEQAAKIQGMSRVTQAPVPSGNVAPFNTLRARILAVSLFPNLFNRSGVMKDLGSTY